MKLKATIRASLWYMAAMVTAIGALLVSSGIEHSANGWEMLGWAAAALVLLAAALAMLGLGCCADKESSAYRLLSEASRDKQLSTQDWIALFEQYREGVKQQ